MSKISNHIRHNVIPRGMTQQTVADRLGVQRQSISRLLNGKVRLSESMAYKLQHEFGVEAEKLLQIQRKEAKVQYDPTNHSFTKNFYRISANDIENYFGAEKVGQEILPILIRKLVRQENKHLIEFDFPGGNNSQRHGNDGFTHAREGTKFVPEGRTIWEFGTSKNANKKAESDFTSRTKDKSKDSREGRSKQTFVFVTPMNWPSCKSWVNLKNDEKEFKEVRCYDASSLEQWLEGHPLIQLWFAELRGVDTLGLTTLGQAWKHWSLVCSPVLSPILYGNSIEKVAKSLLLWSKSPSDHTFNVQGTSREEVKAFFGAARVLADSLIPDKNKETTYTDNVGSRLTLTEISELIALLDRCVIVDDKADAGRLALTDPAVVPISVTRQATENCLAAFQDRKVIIGFDSDISQDFEPHFRIDKTSFDKFHTAMDDMGISDPTADRISHATKKSPFLIRRHLAGTPDLKKPKWCERLGENINKLVPIFLTGQLDIQNEYDLWVLNELSAECCDCSGKHLLRFWRGLIREEDSPVYQNGKIIGIRAPLECLSFVCRYFDDDILDLFFTLCWHTFSSSEAISSEMDNSAQLRFEPSSHRPSNNLRRGLMDTITLLSVHGEVHIDSYVRPTVSQTIDKLMNDLLSNSSVQDLFELTEYLPQIAEASPAEFLFKVENEVESVQSYLYSSKPNSDERYFLLGLLERIIKCLEIVAWDKNFVERACMLFAKFSMIAQPESDAEHTSSYLEANSISPEQSLGRIMRQFRPCTSANEKKRVEILRRLYSEVPDIGFSLSVREANRKAYFQHENTKPDYRDWASTSHSSSKCKGERLFLKTCYEILLEHPYTNFTEKKELIQIVKWFPKRYETALLSIISGWLHSASSFERVEIYDQVRRLELNRKEISQTTNTYNTSNSSYVDLKKLRKLIKTQSVIEKNAWLFKHGNVERPYDDFKKNNGRPDFEAMRNDTEKLQLEAMREIWSKHGEEGFIDLLEHCRTGQVPSTALMKLELTKNEIVGVVLAIINKLGEFREKNAYSMILQFALSDILAMVDSINEILPTVLDKLEQMKSDAKIEMLLKNLPVNNKVLQVLQTKTENQQYETFYWKNVDVNFVEDNIEHCLEKLFNSKRYEDTVTVLGKNISKVKGSTIASYLRSCSESIGTPFRQSDRFQNTLYNCMVKLSKSEVSNKEIADIEFLYADVLLLGGTSYSIPTVIKFSREDPNFFFSLVAGCTCRKDRVQDRKKFRFWDKFGSQTKVCKQCYAILTPINYVFSAEQSMIPLDTDEAIAWAEKVVYLAERHDRMEITFCHIGVILGKRTSDLGEMFPDELTRRLFEKFQSEDLTDGWKVGFDNNGKGETTKTYSVSGKNSSSLSNLYKAKAEEWAEESEFSSNLMRKMAECYETKEKEYLARQLSN